MYMLTKTSYVAPINIIENEFSVGKHTLTEPTGDFFYDPWKLKSEFQGSKWESVLSTLPFNIGQARIIVLEAPSCYTKHADIDDRYHLNLSGDNAFLIDLQSQDMYKLELDGIWYEMDAGRLHTAINVGSNYRMQLVVRKLLHRNTLINPVEVSVTAKGHNPRYVFDNRLSPWLNRANKRGIITNFVSDGATVYFDIENSCIAELNCIMPEEFSYEYS